MSTLALPCRWALIAITACALVACAESPRVDKQQMRDVADQIDGADSGVSRPDSGVPPEEDSATPDSSSPRPNKWTPSVPFDYQRKPGATTSTGQLPATIGAGEVLAFSGQTTTTDMSITCAGTQSNPAFIIGGTLSGNSDVLRISGSWCIFDGTRFVGMQPRTSGDHIVFRNVEITGLAKNGTNLGGDHIVIADSEIHHNQRAGKDAHGIQVGTGAKNVWILRNVVHHNSGNGLQACHGCSAAPPSGIYITQNVFYADREVAVGLKYADNVVIENNLMHSYVVARAGVEWCFDDNSGCSTYNSGSDGSAIVVGADGAPTRVLIAGNEIHGTNNAVRIEESDGVEVIGNNMHDVARTCLVLDKQGMKTVFRANTCARASRGIHQHWRDGFSLTVEGNTFSDLSGPSIEYESRGVCTASTLTGNTFASAGAVICANDVASTTSAVNALPGASGNTVK